VEAVLSADSSSSSSAAPPFVSTRHPLADDRFKDVHEAVAKAVEDAGAGSWRSALRADESRYNKNNT
jgi:hypothetical protein